MKIFITGVSEGIGHILAQRLVEDGHIVWGVARREDLLSNLQSKLGADHFSFTVCDVGNDEDIKNTVAAMKEKNFLPDVVVLNAVFFGNDLNPNFNYSIFKKALAVNVGGSLGWVDAFLSDFLKRNSGRFIAISSTAAYRPNLQGASLSASKAAVAIAFRSLQARYFSQNIQFDVIYLGTIATPSASQWIGVSGKPNHFFVSRPENVARFIQRVIQNKNKKTIYWFPFFITLLFRLSLFLPDRFFMLISKYLNNKNI